MTNPVDLKPAMTQEWVLESIEARMKETGATREEAVRLFSLEVFGVENILNDPRFSKLPRGNRPRSGKGIRIVDTTNNHPPGWGVSM